MPEPIDAFESRLAAALQDSPEPPNGLTPVLHRARARLAVRNVLGLVLGRVWLALARLLAPAVARLHRASVHR
jgi:hypothetical protein